MIGGDLDFPMKINEVDRLSVLVTRLEKKEHLKNYFVTRNVIYLVTILINFRMHYLISFKSIKNYKIVVNFILYLCCG